MIVLEKILMHVGEKVQKRFYITAILWISSTNWQRCCKYQSHKYKYKYKYLTLKYKYKYKYLTLKYKYSGHKYKYKYKYFKMVLKYYSSTSTNEALA